MIKVGDKIYGYCQTRERQVFIEITNIYTDDRICYGEGYTAIDGVCGPIPFDSIITEEIYNSTLYKIMREVENDV